MNKSALLPNLMLLGVGLSIALAGPVAQPIVLDAREKEWIENSFEDFIDGDFWTESANLYVSRTGRLQSVYRWDLNHDGYLDILFSQAHENDEAPDSVVYLNPSSGSPGRIGIPALAPWRVALADLNNDGYPEAILANGFYGETANVWSYIYWGGPNGYNPARRTELPAGSARAVDVGDLNQDGYPDLVFALRGGEHPETDDDEDKASWSVIYWGGPLGYSQLNKLLLPTFLAIDCKVVDLNNDGFLDIVFVNDRDKSNVLIYWGRNGGIGAEHRTSLTVKGASSLGAIDLNGDKVVDLFICSKDNAVILWGSSQGFQETKRTILPVTGSVACDFGDLNRDGSTDIVVAISSRDHSTILWGGVENWAEAKEESIPTLNATAVRVAELNQDGHPDLIFCNESNRQTYDTVSYVYWGSPSGYSSSRRKEFSTHGANGVAVADMDRDGKLDLLFANRITGRVKSHIYSYIYWGNAHSSYSPRSRTELLTHGAYGASVGDINDDGYADVVFANFYTEASEPLNGVYVYLGGPTGFSLSQMSVLAFYMVMTTKVADLNRDGYLDIVMPEGALSNYVILLGGPGGIAADRRLVLESPGPEYKRPRGLSIADLNRDGYPDLITSFATVSNLVLYWGGPQGYHSSRTMLLPAVNPGVVKVADLNADGYLDIVLPNFVKDPKNSNYSGHSYIYWGSSHGFSTSNRQEIPVDGAARCTVQDFNGDGLLDIAVTSYYSNSSSDSLSLHMFWGNTRGYYSREYRTRLPVDNVNGLLAADLNADGHIDLVVSTHKRFGNHTGQSAIFWGTRSGYSNNNTTWLPTAGPNDISVEGVDLGNIYSRKLEESYTSSVFDCGPEGRLKSISWKAETPLGTGVKFQIRTAATREALPAAPWTGWFGAGSFYTSSGSPIQNTKSGDRWVQYRAVLTTTDGGNSAILKEVKIRYESQ